jgi:hypothetical protein
MRTKTKEEENSTQRNIKKPMQNSKKNTRAVKQVQKNRRLV